MAIYVPSYYYEALTSIIYDVTGAGISNAQHFAGLIVDTARAAADDALSTSEAYTDIIEQIIYNNVDDDLDALGVSTNNQIDIVVAGLTASILLLQTQIDDLHGGIGDDIAEELDRSYGAIAESHGIVGNLIDATLASVGAQVAGSYEEVGTWIHDGFEGALAVVNSTIDHIIKAVDNYVQSVIDFIIPAEQQAIFETIGGVLLSGPMLELFDYGGSIFKTQLNKVLTIDEEELETWIARGSELVHSIAMKSAEPEEVT